MRESNANGRPVRMSPRGLVLSAVALGVGLLVTSGVARAQDDDDKTFEEKIIEGFWRGLGATNMDNTGIDYRERSPLVVPRTLDLPPPASAKTEVTAPNWPKDADETRRKAMLERRRKEKNDTRDAGERSREASRVLLPSEVDVGRTAPSGSTSNHGSESEQPGSNGGNPLNPNQLGFETRFSNFFGGNKTESTEFKGEPTRDALTQPPPGYQTPSPNFAYGTGKSMETMNKEYNPAAGKYGDQ